VLQIDTHSTIFEEDWETAFVLANDILPLHIDSVDVTFQGISVFYDLILVTTGIIALSGSDRALESFVEEKVNMK
jgi:hypothetical protein